MTQQAEIARALLRAGDRPVALATVVGVQGSAYRREGAKMVIDEQGQVTGMISGGCLEPEVARWARQVLASSRPERRRFDLRDDTVWGLGIGCGGTIDVLVEPVQLDSTLKAWCKGLETGRWVVRAVVHASSRPDLPLGSHLIQFQGEPPQGPLARSPLGPRILQAIETLRAEARPPSRSHAWEGIEVLLDVHLPAFQLVVFGAGDDAIPLVAGALRLGFQVSVVDPREAFLRPERFPGARLLAARPGEFQQEPSRWQQSFVVIMNHHLERDCEALQAAIQAGPPYIGVLGPRDRLSRLLRRLEEAGFCPGPDDLERVYSPVGLDLGAEGPEEIALSILSEILAVRNQRPAGFLREETRPALSSPASS